jgi:hypothetical protein
MWTENDEMNAVVNAAIRRYLSTRHMRPLSYEGILRRRKKEERERERRKREIIKKSITMPRLQRFLKTRKRGATPSPIPVPIPIPKNKLERLKRLKSKIRVYRSHRRSKRYYT